MQCPPPAPAFSGPPKPVNKYLANNKDLEEVIYDMSQKRHLPPKVVPVVYNNAWESTLRPTASSTKSQRGTPLNF
jgi:hypothetical protein